MEENKEVVKPVKEVKTPKAKKVAKKPKNIVSMSYARGLFVTGVYGILMYGFDAFGLFNNSQIVLDILSNVQLQISITMFLIGLFSIKITKK